MVKKQDLKEEMTEMDFEGYVGVFQEDKFGLRLGKLFQVKKTVFCKGMEARNSNVFKESVK